MFLNTSVAKLDDVAKSAAHFRKNAEKRARLCQSDNFGNNGPSLAKSEMSAHFDFRDFTLWPNDVTCFIARRAIFFLSWT